jgi:hypothetical protein
MNLGSSLTTSSSFILVLVPVVLAVVDLVDLVDLDVDVAGPEDLRVALADLVAVVLTVAAAKDPIGRSVLSNHECTGFLAVAIPNRIRHHARVVPFSFPRT